MTRTDINRNAEPSSIYGIEVILDHTVSYDDVIAEIRTLSARAKSSPTAVIDHLIAKGLVSRRGSDWNHHTAQNRSYGREAELNHHTSHNRKETDQWQR